MNNRIVTLIRDLNATLYPSNSHLLLPSNVTNGFHSSSALAGRGRGTRNIGFLIAVALTLIVTSFVFTFGCMMTLSTLPSQADDVFLRQLQENVVDPKTSLTSEASAQQVMKNRDIKYYMPLQERKQTTANAPAAPAMKTPLTPASMTSVSDPMISVDSLPSTLYKPHRANPNLQVKVTTSSPTVVISTATYTDKSTSISTPATTTSTTKPQAAVSPPTSSKLLHHSSPITIENQLNKATTYNVTLLYVSGTTQNAFANLFNRIVDGLRYAGTDKVSSTENFAARIVNDVADFDPIVAIMDASKTALHLKKNHYIIVQGKGLYDAQNKQHSLAGLVANIQAAAKYAKSAKNVRVLPIFADLKFAKVLYAHYQDKANKHLAFNALAQKHTNVMNSFCNDLEKSIHALPWLNVPADAAIDYNHDALVNLFNHIFDGQEQFTLINPEFYPSTQQNTQPQSTSAFVTRFINHDKPKNLKPFNNWYSDKTFYQSFVKVAESNGSNIAKDMFCFAPARVGKVYFRNLMDIPLSKMSQGTEFAQAQITKIQHPTDCNSAKFFAIVGGSAGFGSNLVVGAKQMSWGLGLNKTTIMGENWPHFGTENEHCPPDAQTFDCYMQPLTKCTRRHLVDPSMNIRIGNITFRHFNATPIFQGDGAEKIPQDRQQVRQAKVALVQQVMKRTACEPYAEDIYGDALINFYRNALRLSEQTSVNFHKSCNWVHDQLLYYVFQPNFRTKLITDHKMLKLTSSFKKNDYILVDPQQVAWSKVLSMFIRRSDKCGHEADCKSVHDYFQHLDQLVAQLPAHEQESIKLVFVTSEDASVYEELAEFLKTDPAAKKWKSNGFQFLTTLEFDESPEDANKVWFQRSMDPVVQNTLFSMFNHFKCRAHVGPESSNFANTVRTFQQKFSDLSTQKPVILIEDNIEKCRAKGTCSNITKAAKCTYIWGKCEQGKNTNFERYKK